MINKFAFRILLLAGLVSTAGCSSSGIGLPWVKQGPGVSPEEVAAARREQPKRSDTPAVPKPSAPAPSTVSAAAAPRQPEKMPQPADKAAATTGPGALSSYTQATRYGDMVYVSGQIAIDPQTNQLRGEKIEEQTRQVMENIRVILDSHRLTLANIVSVTVYLKDINDLRGMNGVYESFFRTALPSRSVIEVARMRRLALVEISVVAGR